MRDGRCAGLAVSAGHTSSPGEGAAATAAQAGGADVGALALAVAGAVAAAAVTHAGGAGYRVRLPDLVPDDLAALGQDQRGPVAEAGAGGGRPGGGLVLGRANPGHYGGRKAQQPAAAPAARVLAP